MSKWIDCSIRYDCFIRVYSINLFYILQTNTFQCVLATSPTESFVIFLYADGGIQWTTGDDSGGINGLGGTESVAGINAGDGINSITIPGSLTPSIINITQTSNVGIPGVWMFKVGEGNVLYNNACYIKTHGSYCNTVVNFNIWIIHL